MKRQESPLLQDGEYFKDTQYARMRQRLNRVIKSEEDSILFHFLCACCQGKIERIGGRAPLDTTIFMV